MWGKSICYLSKENIPHLEISETDTSLCGLMWRHMTCCRLLFWPPSWLDNLWRKQNASIFYELQPRLALLLTENLEALQTSGWPILSKKECFFFSTDDGDKVQDEAWSLFFFISAWLDVKTFPWSGLLYVLLTSMGFKKMEKSPFFVGFSFWTKSIDMLEIPKCSKLKREPEDFREKNLYLTNMWHSSRP